MSDQFAERTARIAPVPQSIWDAIRNAPPFDYAALVRRYLDMQMQKPRTPEEIERMAELIEENERRFQ